MLNPPLIAVVRAGAAYSALVFGAGFALGLIRVPYLVPRYGERIAELMETPVMLAAIFFASRYIVRRFALASSARLAVAVGMFALMLLVAAELLLMVALQGRDLAGYVASRDPVSGSVYLASLLLYALMPWLQARLRRSADPCVDTSV
jgi:lipid-A-disaccharide synthase-like uncharacterized protein